MKKLASLLCLLIASSCSNQETILLNEPLDRDSKANTQHSNVLSFSSKRELDFSIQNEISPNTIRRKKVEVPSRLRSSVQVVQDVDITELVPEEAFRKYLSNEGEVIVNDTLYKITKYGTLYAHLKHSDELFDYYSKLPDVSEQLITEKTYRSGNVYRYDTFHGITFEEQDESEEILEIRTSNDSMSGLRSNAIIPSPNIDSFELVDGSKNTYFGKLLQDVGIANKHLTTKFPKSNKLRLNCWMFDYNYVIKSSIGFAAKIQFKTWLSWAKVSDWEEGALRVGLRNVIVRYDYPKGFPPFYALYNNMHNIDREKDVARYVRNLTVPSWFYKSPFQIAIPFINKDYSPRYVDLMKLAFQESSKIFKSLTNYQKYPSLGYDGLSGIIPNSLRQKLSKEDIQKMIVVGTPIYAEDGIYVLYPYGELMNINTRYDDQKRNQVIMRFGENHGSFGISFTTSLGQLGSGETTVKPMIIDDAGDSGTFVSGEFYACGYHSGDWVGYRVHWGRPNSK